MSVKESISALVDAKADLFTGVSDEIWKNPELGFKEFKSAKVLIDALKAEGFAVEEGLAGIPTAFSGTFGSGKPVIGFLGEFDALPSLSQEASCATHKEVVKDAPGHGCGHNALGAGSLAAAGLYALDHQVQRLADDHANAQWLGDELRKAGYTVEPVQTNMVYVDIGDRAQALKAFAAERGIKLSAAPRLRMVTHLDVSRAQIEQVLAAFVEFSRK